MSISEKMAECIVFEAAPGYDNGTNLANILTMEVNDMCFDYAAAAEEIAHTSGLNANMTVYLFGAMMYHMAKRTYDARNEASHRLACKLSTGENNFVSRFVCDVPKQRFSEMHTGFAEGVCNSHRTLQQSVVRLFLEILRVYDREYTEDTTAAAIREILSIADTISIPFI